LTCATAQGPRGPQSLKFDLAMTSLDETWLKRAWLDLICEAPAMSRITVESAALNRRPRAEL